MPKVETLRDYFPGNTLNAQWTHVGGLASVGGGLLHLASHDVSVLAPGASPYSTVHSTATLDATDSSAFVQTNNFLGYFSVGGVVTPYSEFFRDGADLVGDTSTGGSDYAEVFRLTYDSTTHRFLRLRNESGTLYWDTSSDATTWINRASRSAASADFTSALVFLISSPVPGDPEQTFASVNMVSVAPTASALFFG